MANTIAVRQILLATDLEADSLNVLAVGHRLAKQLGAKLHLLSVLPARHDAWGAARERKLQLEQAMSGASLDGVEVLAEARVGRVDEVIVEAAREHNVDLIILGTRGRSRWTKAIAGSVAEHVIRAAHCPVIVVPPWHSPMASTPIDEAARRLSVEFGPGLVGGEEESRSRMTAFLARTFEIGEPEVAPLLTKLESAGVVRWHEVNAGNGEVNHFWSIRPEPPTHHPLEPETLPSSSPPKEPASVGIALLHRAIQSHATDIHLDPIGPDQFQVRFRIDGRMEDFCRFDRAIAYSIIQQYKVLAELDIADPFKPQEGRLNLPPGFDGSEIRLTSAPVHTGQAVALRIFRGDRLLKPIEDLGLSGKSLDAVNHMLRRGCGLVLATGPTGAGKTTLIYSLLNCLSCSTRNIISIEDPIEFPLPFIRQIAVDPRHGITMTSGLRTLLRMDPDIVFLGEIRDAEAADAAMRAGSAGRFVFSTLHTRDVASTITAIRDLHIDNRSLAANLTGIISQRLVRRLCLKCRQLTSPTEAEAGVFVRQGLTPPETIGRAVGCDECRGTGFRDRIGVFEAVVVTSAIAEAIVQGASEADFEQLLRDEGFLSLMGDGLQKVIDGVTSLDEILQMYRLDGASAGTPALASSR